MKRVVLISCVSKKLGRGARAEDLYVSPLFRYNLAYARLLNPDKIFVLSAKYGLICLDDEINPYDRTMNKMSLAERKDWANNVFNRLSEEVDVDVDEVIFLAGKNYREFLVGRLKNFKVPLEGLGIGRQLKFLKEQLQ